ncbi:MAG TPA: hypothetical protein VM869_10575 [Enhygromyxa sp.]|nr:hypothetical protein [Enhygromyxa sp.]
MSRRSLVWVVAATVAWLSPSAAEACSFKRATPITIARPTWPAAATLELVAERIEVECGVGRRKRHCRFESVWTYEGSPGVAVDGVLTLPSSTELESVTVGIGDRVDVVPLASNGRVEVFALHVDDGGQVEVRLSFEGEIYSYSGDPCGQQAGYARHLVVAREEHFVEFLIGDGQPLEHVRTQIDIRAPPRWRVSVEDGPESSTRSLHTEVDSDKLQRLRLANRPFAHGPFAAAGVGFGPQIRARLRAGYEVAAPPFMLYSLAVEGDAVEELMLIPAVEVASFSMTGVIPSGGLGVGVPVMLLPEPLVGFRLQWGAVWPFVGLLGSFDVYPRPGAPAMRGALMLQITI